MKMTVEQLVSMIMKAGEVAQGGFLAEHLTETEVIAAFQEEPKLTAFFNEFGRLYAAVAQ